MSIRFSILSSGSTGNCSIIQTKDAMVMLDVGLSTRSIEKFMQEKQVEPKQLSAIVITHEHSDHIKGLGSFVRKYDVKLVANEATWEQLERYTQGIKPDNRVVMHTSESLNVGSLSITSFPISHDAAEPVGYVFRQGGYKVSFATDLGYVSRKVVEAVGDSDVLVLEANHDEAMLRSGKYPWSTKQRILGDKGHLSNRAAGEALPDLITDRTKRIYLAHLSLQHNQIDLAKLTINDELMNKGIVRNDQPSKLRNTFADRATEWDTIDS